MSSSKGEASRNFLELSPAERCLTMSDGAAWGLGCLRLFHACVLLFFVAVLLLYLCSCRARAAVWLHISVLIVVCFVTISWGVCGAAHPLAAVDGECPLDLVEFDILANMEGTGADGVDYYMRNVKQSRFTARLGKDMHAPIDSTHKWIAGLVMVLSMVLLWLSPRRCNPRRHK